MYLGLTGYNHESSAALVNEDGVLVDYIREEMLSRIKGDKSFPKRSIDKILSSNCLKLSDLKSVVFYERPLSCFLTTLKTAALNMPKSLSLIANQCRNFEKSSIACFLNLSKSYPGLEKKLIYLDHHLSHTLTALSYSYSQEDICSIVVDGFGDNSTASISKVNDLFDIRELWSCDYPVSIGLFYSAITDFLGFQVNEGEYKVMGLSSFGNSDSTVAKNVFNLLKWDFENNKILLDMSFFSYHVSPTKSYSKKLESLLGKPRNSFMPLRPEEDGFDFFADVAKGAQDAVINVLCELFKYAHKLTGNKKFLFSGGVAMNSAALDEISKLDCVDQVIIPPSPGDAGSAIGAAYYGYLKKSSNPLNKLPKPSLFPSSYDSADQSKLAKKIIFEGFEIVTNDSDEMISIVAKLISKGEIIGTIYKNAETGPRALGNRSLICDGKNVEAVNRLNTVIKNRSPFRPTAPCMKLEVANKYYILRKELLACYSSMSATCKCKPKSPSLNFPTTHVDLSARLQIAEDGQLLFKVLTELESYGVEILANSSFNLSGDPTCYDLIDALMVGARSPLKYILTDFALLKAKP